MIKAVRKIILTASLYLGRNYHKFKRCCKTRLTAVMPTQQLKPNNKGLPPVLINLIISVFRPIALMASTMKNLLSSLIGLKTLSEKPTFTATVVITEAKTKYRIKNGKILLRETFLLAAALFLPA